MDAIVLDCAERKCCEQCGIDFQPRNGSGGEQQRFCSDDCRGLFHRGQRRSHRAPPSPPCSAQPLLFIDQPKPQNAPTASPERSKDFDWSSDSSIILREQPVTACYFNADGPLVIRQRRWPDDDAIIVIAESSLDIFLDKLTDACGIPSFGRPD
jgi:hypothetical protein